MKEYTKPEMIITSISNEDIITLSGVFTTVNNFNEGKFTAVEF